MTDNGQQLPAGYATGKRKHPPGIKKQVNMMMPVEDWRRLREHAARKHTSMSDLLQEWIEPKLRRLRK